MKITTNVKAGGVHINYNQSSSALKVRTSLKAGAGTNGTINVGGGN